MNATQEATWRAVQARLRHGESVAAGVERCLQAGIAVRVLRIHLGPTDDPKFGASEDVSAEYGVREKRK